MIDNDDTEYQVVRKRIKKKQKKTSNAVLAFLGFFVFLFVTAMIVTYWKFESVPDELIKYVLGAGGLEVLVMAGIKISKVWSGNDDSSEGGS